MIDVDCSQLCLFSGLHRYDFQVSILERPMLQSFLSRPQVTSPHVHPTDAPEPRACRGRRGTSAVRGTVGNAESTLPATAPETVSSIDRWFCLLAAHRQRDSDD